MRVAMLSHHAAPAAPTGAERVLEQLARGLAARGCEPAVAAPGPWALAPGLAEVGIELRTIPVRCCWLVQFGPQPLWRQAARAVRYALPDRGYKQLGSWLARLQPDVVHVNCLPHLRGAAAARALGLPVVWHVHEILPPGPRRRWFARRLERDATRIVAVSEAVAGWMRAEGLGERLEVVHNGVEPPADPANGRPVRLELTLPERAVVVGLFGQLVEHKGAFDFVCAAAAAAAEESQLHFLIAGGGKTAFVNRLQREINRGGAADRIRLLPPQDDIWPLLAAVDVVALTTLWPDPLPRVVMEAMAAGLPVVAYGDGGVPEMVIDGGTGLILDSGDWESLAEAMLQLARDPDLRARLGEAGRLRAERLFGVDRHLERMEAVLSEAVSIGGHRA